MASVIHDKLKFFTERDIVNFAKKMLEVEGVVTKALAYLERKNIIHRDIKPDNVVFARAGSYDDPVLVDLGFATYEKDFKNLFTRCGTPGHVAPEVLKDQEYTSTADVYSLGVVIHNSDHALHDDSQGQPFRKR